MLINLNYLQFSDAAKYADIAKNIVTGKGFTSNFEFFGGPPVVSPIYPRVISLFFYFFGISDLSVIATSIVFLVLSFLISYLITYKFIGNKYLSILTAFLIATNKDILNYGLTGASESLFIFLILFSVYLFSFRKKNFDYFSFLVLTVMYFTRPQSVVFILCILIYYYLLNFKIRKTVLYSVITLFFLVIITMFSGQTLFAITQVQPGVSISNTMRGLGLEYNFTIIFKKFFYNTYNLYKALPDIINPYLLSIYILGFLKLFKEDFYLRSLKIFSAILFTLTIMSTAITIPLYRYIHPVIPIIYIVFSVTLYEYINSLKINMKIVGNFLATVLFLFFSFNQTLGSLILDSRFESKSVNISKPPIYYLMAKRMEESTSINQKILTNLDTWGSWYGNRFTVWYPISPKLIETNRNKFDAIYLTSYKMDDENYYMGEEWREIFNNPEKQKVLSDFIFVKEYKFDSNDNYEKENGRSILLVRR